MRTASLRSGTTPFRRISEVATEYTQRRRTAVPERAEVVAVHGDDDWFALFADEGEKAPAKQPENLLTATHRAWR